MHSNTHSKSIRSAKRTRRDNAKHSLEIDHDALRENFYTMMMHIAHNHPKNTDSTDRINYKERSHIEAFIIALFILIRCAPLESVNPEDVRSAVSTQSEFVSWVSRFKLTSSHSEFDPTKLNTPSQWGPHYWAILEHVIAVYPERPRASDIVNAQSLFKNLVYVLPCEECRVDYRKFLEDNPIATKSNVVLKAWLAHAKSAMNSSTLRVSEPLEGSQLETFEELTSLEESSLEELTSLEESPLEELTSLEESTSLKKLFSLRVIAPAKLSSSDVKSSASKEPSPISIEDPIRSALFKQMRARYETRISNAKNDATRVRLTNAYNKRKGLNEAIVPSSGRNKSVVSYSQPNESETRAPIVFAKTHSQRVAKNLEILRLASKNTKRKAGQKLSLSNITKVQTPPKSSPSNANKGIIHSQEKIKAWIAKKGKVKTGTVTPLTTVTPLATVTPPPLTTVTPLATNIKTVLLPIRARSGCSKCHQARMR